MFDSSIYDINKTIPRKADLKKLCSKHSTTEAAIDVIAGQVKFERVMDEFQKNGVFGAAIDATGDYAAKWNGWKTTAGKKHPKFVASFEKEILPKIAKVAKELTTQKKEKAADDEKREKLAKAFKEELTKPTTYLAGTCQEIMVDAVTMSSTDTEKADLKAVLKKISTLALSIEKRISGSKPSLHALVSSTRGNKKATDMVKAIVLDFKEINQMLTALSGTSEEELRTKEGLKRCNHLLLDVHVVGKRLHSTAKKLRDDCAHSIDYRSTARPV